MKILIIAHDFPPNNSIGAKRPYAWHKDFSNHGIYSKVIARNWSNNPKTILRKDIHGNKVHFVPYINNLRDNIITKKGENKFIFFRKILTFLLIFRDYIFPKKSSLKRIYEEANTQLSIKKYDFIIATGEPFILFGFAHKLSKKHNIPWVADYRDVWTSTISNQVNKGKMNKLMLKFYSYFEKKWVNSSFFICTAAPSYKEELCQLFPSKDIEVIYNGYFKNEIDKLSPEINYIQESDELIISYPGTVYKHQMYDTFLQGIRKFHQTYPEIKFKVRFIGLTNSLLIRSHKVVNELPKMFEFHDKMPYSDMIKLLCESDILLLLSKKGANWLNAKIFDYIPLNRPIMMVENDQGILKTILKNINNFYPCDTPEDVSNMIKRFLDKKTLHKNSNIELYSREIQSKRLIEILQKKASYK